MFKGKNMGEENWFSKMVLVMMGNSLIIKPQEVVSFIGKRVNTTKECGKIAKWMVNLDAIIGKGEMFWPDGKHYVGEYENDKKHGEGQFTWESGR